MVPSRAAIHAWCDLAVISGEDDNRLRVGKLEWDEDSGFQRLCGGEVELKGGGQQLT